LFNFSFKWLEKPDFSFGFLSPNRRSTTCGKRRINRICLKGRTKQKTKFCLSGSSWWAVSPPQATLRLPAVMKIRLFPSAF